MKRNAIVTMVVFSACVTAVQVAWAFPTQAEIKTATEVVGDLVADDVRNANAGKLKREDVADKLVGLVDRAESDAAKWVLYKHAFIQYAKAGNFGKAGEVLSDMVSLFPDVPPQTVVTLIDKNCAKANAKNAPVVVKMRKLMLMRQKCGGIVANAKASKKEKAEACCLMGDWAKGLKMFADVGGKAAEMAAAETSGSQPKHVVANYWWDYKSDLDTCDQFKAHAAEIYKAGLEDDSISGLYKDIAEKRIAEMEAVPVVEASSSTTKAKGLVHRWSFNNNLKDSVGKTDGKADGNVSFSNGAVALPGGGRTAGAISFDGNPLPGDKDFTLEIWAALNRIQFWSVVMRLQYPDESKNHDATYLSWNLNVLPDKSSFAVRHTEVKAEANWKIGEMYHIVIRGKKNADGKMTVTYLRAKAGEKHMMIMAQIENASWPTTDTILWLGRSKYWDSINSDAAATYDEVRIWDRALTTEELNKSHKCGPNKLF